MQISFLLRTGFDLNSRRPRGRSWRGGAMETGGQGSFQAVKLQRPARAAVCSHSTKDMAAIRSIKSKLDPKPCSASVSIPLGTLLKWERKQASRRRAQFLCRGRPSGRPPILLGVSLRCSQPRRFTFILTLDYGILADPSAPQRKPPKERLEEHERSEEH